MVPCPFHNVTAQYFFAVVHHEVSANEDLSGVMVNADAVTHSLRDYYSTCIVSLFRSMVDSSTLRITAVWYGEYFVNKHVSPDGQVAESR